MAEKETEYQHGDNELHFTHYFKKDTSIINALDDIAQARLDNVESRKTLEKSILPESINNNITSEFEQHDLNPLIKQSEQYDRKLMRLEGVIYFNSVLGGIAIQALTFLITKYFEFQYIDFPPLFYVLSSLMFPLGTWATFKMQKKKKQQMKQLFEEQEIIEQKIIQQGKKTIALNKQLKPLMESLSESEQNAYLKENQYSIRRLHNPWAIYKKIHHEFIPGQSLNAYSPIEDEDIENYFRIKQELEYTEHKLTTRNLYVSLGLFALFCFTPSGRSLDIFSLVLTFITLQTSGFLLGNYFVTQKNSTIKNLKAKLKLAKIKAEDIRQIFHKK